MRQSEEKQTSPAAQLLLLSSSRLLTSSSCPAGISPWENKVNSPCMHLGLKPGTKSKSSANCNDCVYAAELNQRPNEGWQPALGLKLVTDTSSPTGQGLVDGSSAVQQPTSLCSPP